MARLIDSDIAQSSDAFIDSNGWNVSRGFIVSGIQGQGHQRQYNALTVAGIPRVGDPHPSIPNIYCKQVRIETMDSENAVIVANYSPASGTTRILGAPATIRFGSAVIEVDTNKDRFGDLITVSYDHDPLQLLAAIGDVRTQTGTVQKSVPAGTIEIQQLETQSPLSKQSRFVGRLNRSTWLGFTARTLLCTGITGDSSDGGLTYSTTYTFSDLGVDSDPEIAYQNPDDDNRVPTDVKNGVGIKRVQIYDDAEFSQLGIRGIRR